MPFYSFGFVLALACAGLLYRAGVEETGSGVAWAGASIAVSMFVLVRLDGGVPGVLLAQFGVVAAITAFRLWRDPD